MSEPTLTFLLQRFFTERLGRQLGASPQTVTAYRDTIRLLLLFAAQKTKRPPSRLTIDDLDAVTVGEFLTHLDCDRHNSTATRNARLAAIHSFYRFARSSRSVLTLPVRCSRSRNAIMTGPWCPS